MENLLLQYQCQWHQHCSQLQQRQVVDLQVLSVRASRVAVVVETSAATAEATAALLAVVAVVVVSAAVTLVVLAGNSSVVVTLAVAAALIAVLRAQVVLAVAVTSLPMRW